MKNYKKIRNIFLLPALAWFLAIGSTLLPSSVTGNCGTSNANLRLKQYTNLNGANQNQVFFAVENFGSPVTLKDLKIRMWVYETSISNIVGEINYGGCLTNPSCFHQVAGVSMVFQKFSPACGPDSNHMANWEVTLSTTDNTVLNSGVSWTNLQTNLHRSDWQNFSPGSSKWYSPVVTGGTYKADVRYAIYLKGQLITASGGAPPSCRVLPTCTPSGSVMTSTRTSTKTHTPSVGSKTPTSTRTPSKTPALISPTATFTPNLTPDPKSFMLKPWTVGQHMTIQRLTFVNNVLDNAQTITYSIVGEEVVNGKKVLWHQLEFNNQDGSKFIKKLQVRQPSAVDFENVIAGNQAILLVPRRSIQHTFVSHPIPIPTPAPTPTAIPYEFEQDPSLVNLVESGPAPSATRNFGDDFHVWFESVRVPAGSFRATKFRRKSLGPINGIQQYAESWGAPEVPIWGIVKRRVQKVDPERNKTFRWETDLISYGLTGAQDKLRGVPIFQTLQLQQEALDRIIPLIFPGTP